MSVQVINGDCTIEIPKLVADGIIVDAVVCDPPYNLTATSARFSKNGSAPAKHGKDGAHSRVAKGFMNSAWDTDIAFRPETWATVATILRPGAFLVAFGGTRTHHRVWCAIEDAGFVIQDTIMWLFASGFPKRRDMLKPAFEPIVLAYKPGGKRTMQIDECRIPTNGEDMGDPARFLASDANLHEGWQRPHKSNTDVMAERARERFERTSQGRWPANIVLEDCDEVIAAFPESKGDIRGTEASATGDNGIYGHFDRVPFNKHGQRPGGFANIGADKGDPVPNGPMYTDDGSAARFFFSAKADKADRWHSKHPTVKPIDLIAWLVKLVTPPGGTFLDPFAGSGTAGAAAIETGRNAILIEREASYVADINERLAAYRGEATKPTPRRTHARRDEGGLLDFMEEE